MLDRIEFLFGEAFLSLRRNVWMTFAAITTAAMALFLFGSLAMLYFGLVQFTRTLGDKLEMKAYLKDSVTAAQAKELQNRLLKIDGVASVVFESRTQALEKFKKANPNLDVEGLEIDNPLPNSYIVRAKDMASFKTVEASLEQVKEVEKVRYAKEEQGFLQDVTVTLQWLGATLGILMLLTSGVLIYNAIRMTILARRREIRIMQLVGATKAMVWTPMMIEGAVKGVAGGVLGTLILMLVHTILQRVVVSTLSSAEGLGGFPLWTTMFWLVTAGATYGLGCSMVALRDPVRLWRKT